MTQLPPGYTMRAATSGDLAGVGEVLAAADRAEHGETTLSEEFIRAEWNRPRFDLATDTAVIVAEDGSVAAYGEAFDEATPDVVEGMGVVHPRRRRRGLGIALLNAQERRAREQLRRRVKRVTLRTVVSGADQAGARLVAARGFRPVRTFFHMEIELTQPERPVPPPDLAIRPYDMQRDEPVVYQVIEDAFRGHWGFADQSLEEWWQTQQGAGFDPDLCFLAEEGGEVMGAVIATEARDHGWINDLGVVSAHRHRGIGTLLLRRAFAALAERGQRRALLNVDAENATGALGVYERAGMHVRRRWDVHQKEIGP